MTSARTGGAVSGAASGAAIGAQFGGVYGAAFGAVIGGFAGALSGSSQDSQFANQQAWQKYNSQMQYSTNLANVNSQLGISYVNILATQRLAQQESKAARAAAAYNAEMIRYTTDYNTSLLNEELARVWESNDLELEQLEHFRARETGGLIAQQAASGTVLDQDSNAEVIISQQTLRELDATIIQHNADIAVAGIQNQIAEGIWQGEVAIQRTLWEGEVASAKAINTAKIQGQSAALGSIISSRADVYTSKQALHAGLTGLMVNADTYSNQNQQAMISGLFSAAGQGAGAYYGSKTPGTYTGTTRSGGGQQFGAVSNPSGGYSRPGTSLATG